MSDSKVFILMVLEVGSFMILWNIFNRDEFSFLLPADSVCVVLSLFLYRYAPYGRMLVFHRQANSGIYCLSKSDHLYDRCKMDLEFQND